MFEKIKKSGRNSFEWGKKILNKDDIEQSFNEIKDMYDTVLSPKKQIKNAKQETFTDARRRLNINDLDLLKTYKNYVYCFYLSILFVFICLGLLFYYLFFKQAIIPSIAMLSFVLFSLSNAFRFSFRTFQIRHQKLCSVKEWWDRSEEWFPILK